MDTSFVRERITQLRMAKGISEYQMSYDLGHSRGYINNITSGKSLPSLTELFAICDYFEISPSDFFDERQKYPELIQKATDGLMKLNEQDVLIVLQLIERLSNT